MRADQGSWQGLISEIAEADCAFTSCIDRRTQRKEIIGDIVVISRNLHLHIELAPAFATIVACMDRQDVAIVGQADRQLALGGAPRVALARDRTARALQSIAMHYQLTLVDTKPCIEAAVVEEQQSPLCPRVDIDIDRDAIGLVARDAAQG